VRYSGSNKVYEEIWCRKLSTKSKAQPVDRWLVTAEHIGPVNKLLDVGCGDGTAARHMPCSTRFLVGTDISREACCAARAQGIQVVQSSLDRAFLPFANSSFEAVTCLDVIEHLFDPCHLINELSRVIHPGGHCFISTVNMRYAKFTWQLLIKGRFPKTSGDEDAYDGGHIHYFTARDIAILGQEAGLRLIHYTGLVPSSGRLGWLRQLQGIWPVREFLSAGFLLIFEKPVENNS
jgi:methionine biosynthesis protein MetW